MTFTHTHVLTAPDEEGRQLMLADTGFLDPDWIPFTVTFRPYATPREEIPAAFRSRQVD